MINYISSLILISTLDEVVKSIGDVISLKDASK